MLAEKIIQVHRFRQKVLKKHIGQKYWKYTHPIKILQAHLSDKNNISTQMEKK